MAFVATHLLAVFATTPEVVAQLSAASQVDTTKWSARTPQRDDATVVAALDAEYQAAVERNDAEAMERILADDIVLITGRGRAFSKADLLDEARRKTTVYVHQRDSERQVRVWGDTAVVTALLSTKGATKGAPFEYQVWFSDTYVRTPAGWRYVLGRASTRLPVGGE